MITKTLLTLLLFIFIPSIARAQFGIVCGNPTEKGCMPQYDGFEPHDLPFLTARAALGTGTKHESDEFYAVILDSVPSASTKNRSGCDFISESKRLAMQRQFPRHKVFSSRNVCVGTIVLYDNVNNGSNFVAVYGGPTEAESKSILQKARRRYPTANVRKMKVILDFADQ